MKKTLFKSLAVIALAMMMITCTKEKQDLPKNNNDMTDDQLVDRVHWFMDAAQEVKEGKYLKDGEVMLVDSAVYYISSTINYKYGFHSAPHRNILTDTSFITLPVLHDLPVTHMVDALQGYNSAVGNIRNEMAQISDPDKKLLGCSVFYKERKNDYDEVIFGVIAFIGTGQAVESPASGSYPSFYYQSNSYQCNGPLDYGAPEVISNGVTNSQLVVPANCRVWFTDPRISKTYQEPTAFPYDGIIDNFCDYRIYYANGAISPLTDGVKCLETLPAYIYGSEIQFYINGLNYIINNDTQLQNSGLNFESVSIQHGYDQNKIWHTPSVTFGKKHMVCWQDYYPIDIED